MMAIKKVTVRDMLLARDERAGRQRRLLERHAAPLVSFTMNIPGEVKCDELILRAFLEGKSRILEALGDTILEAIETIEFTGCEYLCAVRGNAAEIKPAMCRIEEADALGRLFDIDVIAPDGMKLSRSGSGRTCLLCGRDARVCGRARTHTAAELNQKAHEIIKAHFEESRAARIGALAKKALIDEAQTTPKPGLVDRENAGAHRDMDITHFLRSAAALESYFTEAALIGMRMRESSADEIFPVLQVAGRKAESAMLRATDGVNTHKGAIFSLGILCCAAGIAGESATREDILKAASELGRVSLNRLETMDPADAKTGGEKQFLRYGLTGVRGEAASGFKSVRKLALPAFETAIAAGETGNDAGLKALIVLMANVRDSNVLRRAGEEGASFVKQTAQTLLSNGFTADDLRRADGEFTKRNLSPGGCADLLAATYFLQNIAQ